VDGTAPADDVTEYWSGSWTDPTDNPTGDLDSAQDAWDQVTNYTQLKTGGISAGKNFALTISKYTQAPYGTEYEARRKLGSQNVEIDFSAYGYTGTAASTWYRVDWNNEFDVDCDWAFGGADGVALANDAESLVYTQGDAISLSAMVTKSLTAEFSSGASPPAGTYGTAPFGIELLISPTGCVF
jgi:hypothetical protein